MNDGNIISALLTIVALLVLGSEVVDASISLLRLHKYQGKVMARVIEVEAVAQYFRFEKYYFYYPTYQYTVNGVTYKNKSSFGTKKECFLVGSEVLLHYDLKKPEKYVAGDKNFWIHDLILHIIAVLIIPLLVLFICLLSLNE